MNKLVELTLIISAALTVSGCADLSPDPKADLIARAKIAAAAGLKDPDSAKFRNLLAYPDKKLVCGEINGKNSFGAYSGFSDFYYHNGYAMIADHDSIFRARLDELCMGALKDQGDAALKRARALWDKMPDSEEKAKAIAEIEKLESGGGGEGAAK